jgi:hypothetical protein
MLQKTLSMRTIRGRARFPVFRGESRDHPRFASELFRLNQRDATGLITDWLNHWLSRRQMQDLCASSIYPALSPAFQYG